MHAALSPLILMFGLLGSFGIPLGVPPLAETQLLSKIAPEQCLFYFSSSGMAAADPKSTNQTEQLLAEPEVQKSFAQIEKLIRSNFGKAAGQNDLPPGISTDDVVDLAKLVLSRPMAVYISDVQMGPQGPSICGGAAIRIVEDGAKLKAKIEELSKTLPPQMIQTVEIGGETFQTITAESNAKLSGNTLTWGFNKKYFLVTMGQGEMESLLKRAGGKAPAWLMKVRQDLPVERVSTVGFINVKAISKILIPMAGPQIAVIMDAIGISNVNNISSVAGLDQNSYVSKMLVSIDGEPQGLLRFATIKPLSAADLAAIPAGTTSAVAAKINPLSVYDAYTALLEKTYPQVAAAMQQSSALMDSQFGLKLREDILAAFGDTVSLYSSTGSSGMPETTLVIQVNDSQKAANSFSKIMQIFQVQFQAAAQGSPIPIKFEKNNDSEKEVYTITIQQPGMPPVQPSWCLTEKELVASASPQSLQAYFTQPAGFKSLAQSPEIAKLLAGDAGPTALVYCNLQQVCDSIYTALPIASLIMQQQGVKLDLSILPSKDAIKGHLTPLIAMVRRTKSGIEITERTPVPGLGITQSTPVLAALLLPAVQSGRGAARRAQSINNMKEIMLALLNYYDANKRLPARL